MLHIKLGMRHSDVKQEKNQENIKTLRSLAFNCLKFHKYDFIGWTKSIMTTPKTTTKTKRERTKTYDSKHKHAE